MKLKIKSFNVYIEEWVIIIWLLCIFSSKIKGYFENYFICYLFIVFHELSHMFVASICGIRTVKLNIRVSGLCIKLNNNKLNGIKGIVIYLAGPVSNIILACIFKNISMVYTINLALAVINLIPIYPLDGYHVLGIILNFWGVKKQEFLQKLIHYFVLFLLLILGVYQAVIFKNISMILMVFYIFIQGLIARKNSSLRLYQEYYKNVTNFN